jgi:hypothetical protein
LIEECQLLVVLQSQKDDIRTLIKRSVDLFIQASKDKTTCC